MGERAGCAVSTQQPLDSIGEVLLALLLVAVIGTVLSTAPISCGEAYPQPATTFDRGDGP
jgi:hypothetical protein